MGQQSAKQECKAGTARAGFRGSQAGPSACCSTGGVVTGSSSRAPQTGFHQLRVPTLLCRHSNLCVCGAPLLAWQAVESIPVYTDIPSMSSVHDAVRLDKPRVVVLGSGWAAASFMKALPKHIK